MEKLFGSYPGARHYDSSEQKGVEEILLRKSPYRYYGLDLVSQTDRLERFCEERFSRKHARAVSSGTAGLHVALYAGGVRPGDEVILPAYAWSADLMAVLAVGATPVITPLDLSLGLDPEGLESFFSSRTRAVIAVHMRGQPCAIGDLQAICRQKKVLLIEDAAQCLGGRFQESPVGSFGDFSVFSFQYHKLITSGEGGVVLCNDSTLHERATRFHDLGMSRQASGGDPVGSSSIQSFGLNYRMSEVQAGLVLAQSHKIDSILRNLGANYEQALSVLQPWIQKHRMMVRKCPSGAISNHSTLGLVGDASEQFAEELESRGITVIRGSTEDCHHYRVWKAFLDREKIPYRLADSFDLEKTEEQLSRTVFIELNSEEVST